MSIANTPQWYKDLGPGMPDMQLTPEQWEQEKIALGTKTGISPVDSGGSLQLGAPKEGYIPPMGNPSGGGTLEKAALPELPGDGSATFTAPTNPQPGMTYAMGAPSQATPPSVTPKLNTDTARTALGKKLYQSATDLPLFDKQAYIDPQLEEVERQADISRKKLGRAFVDPNRGGLSGTAQKDFELFEGGVVGAKAGIVTDAAARASEEARKNIATQQTVFTSGGQLELAETEQQDASNVRQQLADLDDRIRNAQLTGDIDGQKTLEQQRLDLEALLQKSAQTGEYEGADTLEQKRLNLEDKLRTAELTGDLDGADTLQQQLFDLNEEITKAEQTGKYEGEDTIAQQRVNIEQQMADLDDKIRTAELSGDIEGQRTLSAQRLDLENRMADLEEVKVAQSAAEFLATFTGQVGGEQSINADALGINLSNLRNADGTDNVERINQTTDQIKTTLNNIGVSEGSPGYDDIVATILAGEDASIPTLLSMSARDMTFQQGVTLFQTQLAETNAAYDRAIAEGNVTGSYIDPETGDPVDTLEEKRRGFEEKIRLAEQTGTIVDDTGDIIATLQRKQLDLQSRIAAAEATGFYIDEVDGKVKSVETLQKTLQDTNIALQREQFDLEEKTRIAQLTGQISGGVFNAESLGLNAGDLAAAAAFENQRPEEAEKARQTIRDAFIDQVGRMPSEDEVGKIMTGQDVSVASTQTLQGRIENTRIMLERASATGLFEGNETLQRILQSAQIAMQEAELTGTYGKDAEGEGLATVSKLLQNAQLAFERAKITGTLKEGDEETETLQKALQNAQIDIERTQIANQAQQFLTTQTGDVGGAESVTAAALGVSLVGADQPARAKQIRGQLDAALQAAGVSAQNRPDMITKLMLSDGSVNLEGMTMDQKRLMLDASAQVMADEIEQTRNYIERARLMGQDEAGLETLEAQMHQDQVRLENVRNAMDQAQFITSETGIIGGGTGEVTAQQLGVSVDGLFNAQGTMVPGQEQNVIAAAEQLTTALQAAGITADNDMVFSLLKGDPITIEGQTTLAREELGILAGGQAADQYLENRRLSIQEALDTAQLTGELAGDDTLAKLRQDADIAFTELQLTGTATLDNDTLISLGSKLQEFNNRLEEAKVTGLYTAEGKKAVETLQAEIQRAQIDIEEQQADLQDDIQTRQVEVEERRVILEEDREFARQRETALAQTGEYNATVKFDDLDLPLGTGLDTSGRIRDHAAYQTASGIADEQIRRRTGRGGTEAEINALLRGQDIEANVVQSIEEKRRLFDEKLAMADRFGTWTAPDELKAGQETLQSIIARAEATGEWGEEDKATTDALLARAQAVGLWGDDDVQTLQATIARAEATGEWGETDIQTLRDKAQKLEEKIAAADRVGKWGDVDTLQKEQQIWEQRIADQKQTFTEKMAIANELGYMEVGSDGEITAADLGVDVKYLADLPFFGDERYNSVEATRVKDAYFAMTGEELDDLQLATLLAGNPMRIEGDSLRMETLSARASREATELQWADTLGKVGQEKTEAARQFDEQLAESAGMNAAQIASISSAVTRADKELEQSIVEFFQESQMDWAALTGMTGIQGEITAEDLGIPEVTPAPGTEEYQAAFDQVKNSMQSMGVDMSDQEVNNFLRYRDPIPVESSPTLAAKQLTAQISANTMSSQADMMRIANDYEIDRDQLDQYVIESDRNYTQTVENVANQLGMDRMQFALAKTQLEADLTGKVNISGDYTAADLGVSIPANAYALPTEERNKLKSELQDVFGALQGRNLTAAELNTLIDNGAVPVDTLDTQQRQEWANKTAQIAKQYGIDATRFQEGVRQFDAQMSVNDRNSLMQIVGKAEQNADGTWSYPGGGTAYSMDMRKYYDAKNAVQELEGKRDIAFMAALGEDVTRGRVSAEELGTSFQELRGMSEPNIKKLYEDTYGFPLTDQQAEQLKKNGYVVGAPTGVDFANIGENEMIALSNLINGHSMSISQTNQSGSGGGFFGAVGAIAGSFLGGSGFAELVKK